MSAFLEAMTTHQSSNKKIGIGSDIRLSKTTIESASFSKFLLKFNRRQWRNSNRIRRKVRVYVNIQT